MILTSYRIEFISRLGPITGPIRYEQVLGKKQYPLFIYFFEHS